MTYESIKETTAFLQEKGFDQPDTGIVLGTGLGKFVNEIEIIAEVAYGDIPHFPIATVEFHQGKLIYGTVNGKKLVVMQGRFHFYEGYSMQEITFPIRVMKALGVKELLLSNAAGGVNLDFKKGDLVVIEDHINLQPQNPLIGKNLDDLGPRFPDMSEPYSKALRTKLHSAAGELDMQLNEGVYASVMGPNLETRAEYRFLKTIGADLVGMSTVPEVIVANHMDMPCLAVSVVTDECDPDNLAPVNIEEIIEVAGKAEIKLIALMKAYLNK